MMLNPYVYLSFFACAVLTAMAVGLLRYHALAVGLVDKVTARSSHSTEVPRGGGLGIVLVWVLMSSVAYAFGWLTLANAFAWLGLVLGIAILGYVDDHNDIAVIWRLPLQWLLCVGVAVALGVPQSFIHWNHAWGTVVWWLMVVLGALWSTNLFNFMDGTDGLAAVEASVVLGAGGYGFLMVNDMTMMWLCWSLAAACSGFLVWNWPKARIFMGDVSSTTLGFCIAVFALYGYRYHDMSLVAWAIVYAVFWFDTTVTLLRRMWQREAWTMPHRTHAYQRLQLIGWSHAQILVCMLGLNGLCLIAAYWGQHHDQLWVALGMVVGLLTLCYGVLERVAPMPAREQH